MNLKKPFPGLHQFYFFFFTFPYKLHYSATQYLFNKPKVKEILEVLVEIYSEV